MKINVIFFIVSISVCICRDFYMGIFRENDFLVAQDRLYKEKVPYRSIYAKYGRIFKCSITYFRVVDRLGMGRGPQVKIIRGGLRQTYVVAQITSQYNHPISVNIYVGCENKMSTKDMYTTIKESVDKSKITTKSATKSTINATRTSNITTTPTTTPTNSSNT